jgi:hypothetical protein
MTEWIVPDDIKSQLKLGSDKNVQKLLRDVFRYFHRIIRPSYIGPISLEAGITLRQLQLLVDILVHNNVIRLATIFEVERYFGRDHGDAIYTLVDSAKIGLARD